MRFVVSKYIALVTLVVTCSSVELKSPLMLS